MLNNMKFYMLVNMHVSEHVMLFSDEPTLSLTLKCADLVHYRMALFSSNSCSKIIDFHPMLFLPILTINLVVVFLQVVVAIRQVLNWLLNSSQSLFFQYELWAIQKSIQVTFHVFHQ